LFLAVGIFLVIFIYSLVKPSSVGKIDIFLTIVVGFLGTMIGYFYKETLVEKLEVPRKRVSREWLNRRRALEGIIEEQKDIIDELLGIKKD